MKTYTLAEYQDLVRAQGVERDDYAFRCPMCRSIQSARDFYAAMPGVGWKTIGGRLGFACVGRWTGAESPRAKPDGAPCNWSLAGLLRCHEVEVVMDDEGTRMPAFEPVTPEEAQAHARRTRQ